MQYIKISELKSHPRNTEFFDDMEGEKWEEFLKSVKTSGVIEPIVITQDKTIVSGHQRVRACKELGIDTVLCETKHYKDEDSIIKDLLETNIRQRGDIGGSAKKVGRRIKELERLYGVREGSSGKRSLEPNNSVPKQNDIAAKLGISLDTLQNYKLLSDMIPELEDLLDTGIVTKTTALAMMKELTLEEQEELISSLDVTKKITKSQMEKYINEIKRLKENPVAPADYESNKKTLVEYKKKLEAYRKKVDELQEQIEEHTYSAADEQEKLNKLESMYMERINDLEFEKKQLEEQRKLDQEDVAQFNQLKKQIDYLTKQKTDLGRQISSATELSELTVKMQEILEKELAPIKFKRCMEELRYSDIAYDNLVDILDRVETWCEEIRDIIEEERKFDTPQARTHKLFEDFANSDPFELLRQYHNKEGVYAEQEKSIEREYLTPAQMEEKFNREHGIIDVSTLYGDDDEE